MTSSPAPQSHSPYPDQLPPRPGDTRGSGGDKSKGFLGKLFGSGKNKPQGYGGGGYPGQQQSQYGYGSPAPQQGYYNAPPPPSQSAPLRWQPAGAGPSVADPRSPQPYPAVNPGFPAAHLSNPTGGVGTTNGTNFFFPAENTTIMLIKSNPTPPWRLGADASPEIMRVVVPVSTTLGELMRGFGCNNLEPSKNMLCEVIRGGRGKWYPGMSFMGSQSGMLDKPLRSFGWDGSRTGLPGQRDAVWLYVSNS